MLLLTPFGRSASITNLFSIANPYYNLRNGNHFILPRYNLHIGRNSVRYRGPLVWELSITSLKQSPSLKNFKNLLKQRHHKNFLKEACMVSHKNQDFEYFSQSNFIQFINNIPRQFQLYSFSFLFPFFPQNSIGCFVIFLFTLDSRSTSASGCL